MSISGLSRLVSKPSSSKAASCRGKASCSSIKTCFAGVIQLFSAVGSLWTLAKYLEHSNHVLLPWLSIPLLYLVSGIAGCILSANMAFDHNCTGSTAAVSGLLGANPSPSNTPPPMSQIDEKALHL